MSAVPGRRWGWHRLDDRWAARVVAAAGVRPGHLVLDLGAGTGALTRPLAAQGARVLAVELHSGRARHLASAVAELADVTVLQRDLLELPVPRAPFRVVANPPHAISAEMIRRFTRRGSALRRADLVVPRWMAQRYRARPPRGFTAEVGMHVPARAFRPAPGGDCAVLVLRSHRRTRRR